MIDLIEEISATKDRVVVLIDEYDKPILDNLSDLEKVKDTREVLRSFYTVLKSCDEYLRFVFITGISKFSKMGVFPAMNNLEDISMDKRYGDIAGYTQVELENNFDDRLKVTASDIGISRDELVARLKDYYDGFSFDGKTRLYNPFSILQCLKKGEFHNYWYESGPPSFIVEWMREHHISDPEEYRHIVINSNDFISAQEVERRRGELPISEWLFDDREKRRPVIDVGLPEQGSNELAGEHVPEIDISRRGVCITRQ